MFHVRVLIFVLAVSAWFLPVSSHSYGPNVITDEGIVTWNLPVIIDVEGDMTKDCPDSSTVDLSSHISDAATTWRGAPETGLTTTIQTITSGGSPVDIDETNYCDYMFDAGSCPLGGNINGPSEGGYNPVVFDEDGEITDLFFGAGAKVSTLGFAGILRRLTNAPLVAAKGEGVINLYCMSACPGADCTATFSAVNVLAFVTHELGHFLGMNHTQVNVGQTDETYTATMYAVFNPSSGADITTLERDDKVGIASLYSQSPDTLGDDFCTVTGTVRDENGDEFQCANVIVRNVDTSGNKNLSDAMSFVSGGDMPGATSDAGRGRFTIQGLAPGETYQVTVQPIDTTSPLNLPSSGIIPCNGGNGNPSAPTFDAQTLSDTVTCQIASGALVVVNSGKGLTVNQGQTINLDDFIGSGSTSGISLTNTSNNVANGSSNGGNGGSSSGGCSLIR